MRKRRHQRDNTGKTECRNQPEENPVCEPSYVFLGNKKNCPKKWRKKGCNACKPEKLHSDIGENSARPPHNICNRIIIGIAQAGICNIPCCESGGSKPDQHQNTDADKRADLPGKHLHQMRTLVSSICCQIIRG